jgi:hypothetical protein
MYHRCRRVSSRAVCGNFDTIIRLLLERRTRLPVLRTAGNSNRTEDWVALAVIRWILLTVLILGLTGTGLELLLLEHTEDAWQWIPLVLIALTVPVLVWHVAGRAPLSMRAFQTLMLAFVAAGFVGIYFHYQGSVEFRLEANPSLAGSDLFWAAIRSKAPPALAPGTMIELGLIGLAYAYSRPPLRSSAQNHDTADERGSAQKDFA